MGVGMDWRIIATGLGSLILFLGLILGVGYAWSAQPLGAPVSTPEEKAWFQGAQNSMRGSCCSEADGYREGFAYPWGEKGDSRVVLQEWKNSDKEGEYEVKILDQWYHVNKENVVQCGPGKKDPRNGEELPNQQCNPTGGAVVWIIFPDHGFVHNRDTVGGIRCFAPGFQS